MNRKLVRAMKAQNLSVTTAQSHEKLSSTDEEQLEFAVQNGWILVSHNVGDFAELHAKWTATGRPHAGMILIHQQKLSIGECLRRIQKVVALKKSTGMKNELIYLVGVK